MSYPQPNADSYAAKGYKFFRLNTPLACPGDIYESAQSSQALVIGPESDVNSVVVTYFDEQQTNFLNQVNLGVNRSFVGRLDANNSGTYSPAGRPAKMLFYPDILWNANYEPTGFVQLGDTLELLTPVLDVIQYFTQPPSIVPARNDKTFRNEGITIPNGHTAFYAIPYYGRKFASYHLRLMDAAHSMNVAVSGVTFEYGEDQVDPQPVVTSFETLINSHNTVTSVSDVVNAGSKGCYDLLLFGFTSTTTQVTAPLFIDVLVSDVPAL